MVSINFLTPQNLQCDAANANTWHQITTDKDHKKTRLLGDNLRSSEFI